MRAFFEDDDWHVTPMDSMPVLSMGFTGKSGKWMCFAQAREDQNQFVFYSVCPMNVPDDKLSTVAEFITRANYGMIIGNFEMDYADGEVRYKTSIDVEGDNLSNALIKQMVYANVIVMDRYLPGLMRVIFGGVEPAHIIATIEGELPEDAINIGTADDEDFEFKFSLDDIDFSELDAGLELLDSENVADDLPETSIDADRDNKVEDDETDDDTPNES